MPIVFQYKVDSKYSDNHPKLIGYTNLDFVDLERFDHILVFNLLNLLYALYVASSIPLNSGEETIEIIGLKYLNTTFFSFLLLPSEHSLVRQSQEDNSSFNVLPLTQFLK